MTACAKVLGVDKGTVSRELKRNSANIAFGVYLPDRAQNLYRGRRKKCRPRIKMDNPVFRKANIVLLFYYLGWPRDAERPTLEGPGSGRSA